MAEVVDADVVEEIVLRLDVKDLIRCKRVCKSWLSLITSPRFINRHLKHSYNEDRYNNQLGHRRIILADELYSRYYKLVGSSNGLVCTVSDVSGKLLVGNPLTRELRQLISFPGGLVGLSLCWGFGYDSTRDDYQIVAAASKGENQTCLHVLSLKSNVWRVIGEVKYRFISAVGILCNGALHWVGRDETMKILVIAYDLSKEEFKEIPQPEEPKYVGEEYSMRCLGIVKECLCIFGYACEDDVWVMKKYNVKQSWELLPRHQERKLNIVYRLNLPKDESFLHHDVGSWFSGDPRYHIFYLVVAPIFVQSLVSPQQD